MRASRYDASWGILCGYQIVPFLDIMRFYWGFRSIEAFGYLRKFCLRQRCRTRLKCHNRTGLVVFRVAWWLVGRKPSACHQFW